MHTQIRPQFFPPDAETAAKLNLEKCVRILPQLQNTGGFFVSVLVKHKPLPWESSLRTTENPSDTKEEPTESAPPKKKRKIFGYKEDPFFYLADDDETWPMIRDYYKIDGPMFPSVLLARTQEGKKKNIYMTNETVKNVVSLNQEKLKIINTGVKVFSRCNNEDIKCEFRLAQEGLPSIQALIADRIVHVEKDDMLKLLENDSGTLPPKIEEFSAPLYEKLKEVNQGSCILEYTSEDAEFHLVGWRGKVSARVYIAKSERIHYMRLLGGDISKYEVNKFEARSEENGEADKEKSDETKDE
jgi:tRNA (cytosine34-C5)-methyltransferase